MSFKDKAMRPFIIVIFGVLLTACAIIAPGLSYLLSGVTIDTAGGTTTSNESALVSDISSQDVLSSATIKPLKITAPAQSEITVTTAKTVFTGNCDPDEILLINGKKITLSDDGSFSQEFNLTLGKNSFTVEYAGTQKVYTVNYRYVVIKDYSPSSSTSFESSSTMVVRATARFGSTVTATFCGKTISLKSEFYDNSQKAPEFIGYIGSFDLPAGIEVDKNLGKVLFKGTYNGKSESFESGNIILKRNPIVQSDGSAVTPLGRQVYECWFRLYCRGYYNKCRNL